MDYQLSVDTLRNLLGNPDERGGFEGEIRGIASLQEAQAGELSFLSNPKYKSQVAECQASVLLLPADFEGQPGPGALYFLVENPSLELARICSLVESQLWPKPPPGIHPSSVVDPSAQVDPSATIGPLCWVGPFCQVGPGTHLVSHVSLGVQSQVGADSWLAPHVTVGDYCEVGDRCRLHAGVVLGSDGFGYEPHDNRLMKLPQIGVVIVESDVEMGSNCSVDRARFAETRIGAGTKIDNLVQIGHNVIVGRSSALAAQVGISGSSEVGNGVLILGQAGLAGHLKVGDGAYVGGQTGISKDIAPGAKVRGTPHMDIMAFNRMAALQKKLPHFVKRIEKVEDMLNSITQSGS